MRISKINAKEARIKSTLIRSMALALILVPSTAMVPNLALGQSVL